MRQVFNDLGILLARMILIMAVTGFGSDLHWLDTPVGIYTCVSSKRPQHFDWMKLCSSLLGGKCSEIAVMFFGVIEYYILAASTGGEKIKVKSFIPFANF